MKKGKTRKWSRQKKRGAARWSGARALSTEAEKYFSASLSLSLSPFGTAPWARAEKRRFRGSALLSRDAHFDPCALFSGISFVFPSLFFSSPPPPPARHVLVNPSSPRERSFRIAAMPGSQRRSDFIPSVPFFFSPISFEESETKEKRETREGGKYRRPRLYIAGCWEGKNYDRRRHRGECV